MSSHKRPELKLSGNVSENFKNFEVKFNVLLYPMRLQGFTEKPRH